MKFFVALMCLVAAVAAYPTHWAHNGWAHNGWAHNGWAHDGWAHNGWAHNGWNAHHAAPVALTHDAQYLRDTPAVAHAKVAHAVAHASAAHRDIGSHWHGAAHGYAHGYPHHYNHW